MKKITSILPLICVALFFFIYTSCKKILPPDMPTPTPTPYTGQPTLTPTITATGTITCTKTWGTASATCTATISPTGTGTMTCFRPHIASFTRIYQMATPSTVLYIQGACEPKSGLKYTAAVYNGYNTLVAVATAIQTACGELRYTINAPSADTGDVYAWHAGIMEPTMTPPATFSASAPEFTDTDSFYVLDLPPAPTPTIPCSNMAGTYAGYCDPTFMKEDTYTMTPCDRVVYKNYFCLGDYRAAFYDGAGNLQKVQYCPCSAIGSGTQTADYVFTGSENTGTWHVDLFDAASAVIPSTRGAGGNITTCPADITFTVK